MLMTQILADIYGCEPAIEDPESLIAAARAGAAAVKATVVGETTIRYVPHGLTVGVFLAESHIILTTWPEHKLLLLDVLLCNPGMDHDVVVAEIVGRLAPFARVVRHAVKRYIAAEPGKLR
jgi:S-adenosylmethionine decarboxylase